MTGVFSKRPTRGLNCFLTQAFILSLMLLASAFSSAEVAMQSIEFSTLPGDRVEIRMNFDGMPPEPSSYSIEQPARISLDLFSVQSNLASKYHPLGNGNARSVTVLETEDRTRVIVALSELVGYQTQRQGNSLYLLVGRDLQNVKAKQLSAASIDRSLAGGTDELQDVHQQQILDVDFRRGDAGEGRIIVKLSDSGIGIDVSNEGGKIKVTFPNTDLPQTLQRRLDVADFATPVKIVDALREGDASTVTIEPIGEYDYLAYQTDEMFTLEVKPLDASESKTTSERAFLYRGEKLSLNFQDIEIRSVLQLLAEFTGLNLVASDTVAGRITLRLQNVPWDQALDIVMRTKGLGKRMEGNVLIVAPATELAARAKLELENLQQISDLAPLRTEIIKVKYANASELLSLFTSEGGGSNNQDMGGGGSPQGGEGTSRGLISSRGSVFVDDRTNSIILTETAEKLIQFRELLEKLDVPVRQVLIEARIVKASDSFKREAGIRWGAYGGRVYDDGTRLQYGNSLDTVQAFREGTEPDNNLIVDLGTSSGRTGGFAFGLVNDDFLLDLELQLFESEGMGETVSRPTIITSDKHTASVNSGSQIPYQQDTGGGATATSFISATVGLTVTPQITADDRIILELNVTNNSRGDPTADGPPAIDTESIETQVLVNDGETIVLGGLYQTRTDLIQLKTPILGDLPFVGRLFRNSARTNDKDELLIFITPRIIRDSKAVR
jgi:type IV pilus assembly protein PilQ